MTMVSPYTLRLGKLYQKCPKDVLAAIAVSLMSSGGDHMENMAEKILKEWQVLFANGVVNQEPTA